MTEEEVIRHFCNTGALLEGHFIYTSGRHGSQFLQAARVVQHPPITEQLCKAMAERFGNEEVDLVVGPATGGIVLAYETARHLNCRAVYSEKDGEGDMALKRGFHLPEGARAVVVEDIVTTGGSVRKTVDHLRARGADVVGVSVLIDRSAGKAKFDCPFEPLATLDMQSWAPEECPFCKEGKPLVEPDDIII